MSEQAEILHDVRPVTPMERTAWAAMLADLPNGVLVHATRWRDGSYQISADLPHSWHRPGSRIARDVVGTGPSLIHAVTAFRENLADIRAALHRPGQALWSPR